MQTGGNVPDKKWLSWLYIAIIVVAAAAVVGLVYFVAQQTIQNSLAPLQKESGPSAQEKSATTPELNTEVIVSGRQNIWDVDFLPTGEMLFTERKGVLSMLKDGKESELAKISDVRAVGEGGLLGMVVDPEFATNRYIYTCFNSTATGHDVRLVRWQVKADLSGLEGRTDIITGMPTNNGGRHSGCRPQFAPDGYLWVATGDAAQEGTPQSPTSLGGKVLRVDRDGQGVAGNLAAPFDPRIFSYGHRNVQGIAFFAKPLGGVVGLSAEHGPNTDDEINPLVTGNFGWAPGANYNELVPMTDKQRFPDAKDATWSSGFPTQAPSGMAIIRGNQWQGWEGAAAVAMLKGTHLKILRLDSNVKVTQEEKALDGEFGRLRAIRQRGASGPLFVSTDNGSDDKIIRINPK